MKETKTKPITYPRLQAYLQSLPAGLESHPEANTRAFYSLELIKRLRETESVGAWPAVLQSKCQAEWRPDDWIPTTVYSALSSLARDCMWTSEEAYRRGMTEIANEMYGSIFYRSLMLLLSPTLLVRGAASRWAGFNKGTELVVLFQARNSALLKVLYPKNLYSESCLVGLGATINAALSRAKASRPQFSIIRSDLTETEFQFQWA